VLISVSDLKLHVLCPMKFHYQYNLKRGIKREEPAQELGTLAHEILKLKLKGDPGWEVLANSDCGVKEWPSIQAILKVWKPDERWKILHVEEELRLPIGQHTLVGRPDAVVEWLGGYWHLQHKTIASSKPPAIFAEVQRTDWHECVYQRMLEEQGYTPFRGTILNMIRKLALKNIVDDPMKAVEIAYLPRTNVEVDKTMSDIRHRLHRIYLEKSETWTIEKTRSACGGIFGNSLCQYKGVCDGWQKLEDNIFSDLEVRYGENDQVSQESI